MLDYFNIEQYLQSLPTTVGRYVRIQPSGSSDGYITASQFQVIDMNGNNIAKTRQVSAVSTAGGSASVSIVVDGSTVERQGTANVWTGTGLTIDLGSVQQVAQVIYVGQIGAPTAVAARANGMVCQVLDAAQAVVATKNFISSANNQTITFSNSINLTPSPTEETGVMNPLLMPVNAAQPEVYLVSGNYIKAQAAMTCALLGAKPATQGQLREAYNNGARWSSPGWTLDGTDAYYPSGGGVQTTVAGSLPNTDQAQMAITNGTRAVATATAGVNCFGIKSPQGINSSLQPFSSSAWTQYTGNSAPVFYGTTSVSVPDVQKLYGYVTPTWATAVNAWRIPTNTNEKVMLSDLYVTLKSSAPLNFLYDQMGTPTSTITGLNSTIQIFGTVSAAAIADMNTSMALSSKIFLGSIDDVDKYINVAYNDLMPYIRNNVGWTSFCTTEIMQAVSPGSGDYVINVIPANQTSNQSKCNTPLTSDMLGLLPQPAREFIINWVYNRTKRFIQFGIDKLNAAGRPTSAAAAQELFKTIRAPPALFNAVIITYPFSAPDTSAFKPNPATGRIKATVGGAPIAIDVMNTYTLNTIAQSFYEAMGGNYMMTQIYDIFTIGGTILDIRFDLTKHANISAIKEKTAALKMAYNNIRESNVSQDILESAKTSYQTALTDLQESESANVLPPIVGMVGRFFYTYSTATASISITGFTLDARAVTSFIPELNCGVQAATGGAPGALNYSPTTVYTKNIPEALNCTDPLTLRKIFDDYVDLTVSDLAPTLLGTLGADGKTYTGPGGAPSMDTSLGTLYISKILGATQISPTQCALKWTETLWNDVSNQAVSAELTNVTRRALFSYTGNTADWHASELNLDSEGFAFYNADTIPSCVFNPTAYQKSVSPRLDSANAAVLRNDFIQNSWNNGMGAPCSDTIPTYIFSADDYCAANPDLNNIFNNGGKGPMNAAAAKAHYVNNGLAEGRPLRKAQAINSLNPVITIEQPIPANATLDNASGGCSDTTCEDLNVIFTLADTYNQDPTRAGTILRVTRAFTPNGNQCDLEVDINYDATVVNADGDKVKKGSFTLDKDGNEVAVSNLPSGLTRGETRAFTLHREIADCSFVMDLADVPGSGKTIQPNVPALYKPMEYATQFQLANNGIIGVSLGNIATAVSDAAATATSVLSTYRTNTVAAVGNLATLTGGAKCSDTAVLNSILAYYKTQNLNRKQINTILRVGTLNTTTCDITFQEDTLTGTAPRFTVASSTTAGGRFTMVNGAPTAMSYILPAAPPSVTLNMSAAPSSAACSEVYAIGGYNYTKTTAQAKCASYGGTLATMPQLLAAQIAGADWCSTGWLADMSGTAYYPITTSTGPGCGGGSPGIKAYTPAAAGANCFGVKPKSGQYADVLAFAGSTWNQPNACAASLNYVNPGKEAFQNYGPPVYVSESTFPLNRPAFGMDMARNKGGPRLESMFVDPLRSAGDEEETRILSKSTIRPDRATSYKYLRFKPVKTRDPANPTVDVGKFRFLLGDNEIDMGSANVTNPMGTWVGDVGDVIGPGFRRGWSDTHKKALVFAFPYAMLVDGFTWTTANPDSGIGGDPVQWKLEGSQNGVYWTTLREQTKHNYAVPTERFQELPVFRF